MARGDIIVRLLSDTSSLKKGLKEGEHGLAQFGVATKRTHSALMSMTAGMVGAGGLVYGLESAISSARKFQDAMEQIHTQAGASQKEVANMSAALLKLGPAVGQTPENLAKGLYHVESAGLRGAKALAVLKTAAKGAAIGHADLESVTNALVAAQKSGIKGVANMQQAMGSLNSIVGVGNMRMGDLAAALSTGVLPTARGVGISLRDVGAALATMTDAGVPAEQAATRLRMTFSLMSAPTKAATDALGSIGLSQTSLAHSMRTEGLIPALQMLKTHLEHAGLSAEQQGIVISRAFGGGRTSSTIITLLQQLDNVKTKFDEISKGGSSFGEKWAHEQKTAQFASEKFHASLSALQITVANALLPTLTEGLNHVSAWMTKLNDSGDAARYAKEASHTLKDVIHAATPIVKTSAHAFQGLADALGGDKQALEALAGAFTTYKILGKLAGLQAAAGEAGAAGAVGLLSTRLKALATINPIVIPVLLAIGLQKAGQGDPLSLTALAKNGGGLADFLLGPKGHRGLLGDWLTGKGGGDMTSSGAVTGAAPQTGSKQAKNQGAAIAAVAQTQLGIPYQWGGPAILGQHTDCSGLTQAALAKNGIHVGRTTYEQWTQGRPVMPGDLQPGDLVFFHMGPKGPEHVGIYIGNNNFIHDPHTGDVVRVESLSNMSGFCGARRYTTASASTATAPRQSDAGGTSASDIVSQGKAKKAPVLSGSKLLSKSVQLALAKASGTKGTADDLTALHRAKTELQGMPQTVATATELAAVSKRIHTIETDNVKAHLRAQQAEYRKHAAAATAELKKLDAAWKTHQGVLKAAADDAKRIADRSFGEAEAELFKQFDRLTQLGLSRLDQERQQLTPSEQKIKALQDAKAAKTRSDAISGAQSDLAKAIADGDPQAIAAAQAALDQAQYDQQLYDLQVQADAERKQRDLEYGDKAQAYQDQRDLDRQKLSDWLEDQKAALDAGRETWDQFYADLKKKASEGGWDIGTEFWRAWNQAADDNNSETKRRNVAANPGTGDLLQTIQQGLIDGTMSRGLADLLRSGHKLEIPGFADGVSNFRGGLALVGERGPELVSLPGGSSVTPNGAGLTADVPVVVQIGEDALFTAVQRVTLRNKLRNGRNGLG